ncbi:MAG: hypothetical protein RSD54_04605, partial [Ruthenibacterium sp.]
QDRSLRVQFENRIVQPRSDEGVAPYRGIDESYVGTMRSDEGAVPYGCNFQIAAYRISPQKTGADFSIRPCFL